MELNKAENAKDRTANFNKEETTKLAFLLKDFPIITSKKTDHVSNQQKEAAWRRLAEKFNSDGERYRSTKQLQQKFNNMKKTARKEMSVEKRGRKQTGGGPPPPKPSETTEWLNSIMGESISGLPAIYDSDALGNDDITVDEQNTTMASIDLNFLEDIKIAEGDNILNPDKPNVNTATEVTFVLNNTETGPDSKGCEEIYDTSTPKSLLRKPISKQLSSSCSKKKRFTPQETRKKLICHLESKSDLIMKRKACEEDLKKYAEEEHIQNLIERKEMHTKKITLMQEKHNLYIKQQQELHSLEIEFKKKYHKLLLEKAMLEINEIK